MSDLDEAKRLLEKIADANKTKPVARTLLRHACPGNFAERLHPARFLGAGGSREVDIEGKVVSRGVGFGLAVALTIASVAALRVKEGPRPFGRPGLRCPSLHCEDETPLPRG